MRWLLLRQFGTTDCSALGFRNLEHHILRSLLQSGQLVERLHHSEMRRASELAYWKCP